MSDADLPPLPETPLGRYRHYKGGEYEVIGVARHSETLEPLVDLGKRPIRRPRDPATDRPTRMLPRVDSGAAPPQNGQ